MEDDQNVARPELFLVGLLGEVLVEAVGSIAAVAEESFHNDLEKAQLGPDH